MQCVLPKTLLILLPLQSKPLPEERGRNPTILDWLGEKGLLLGNEDLEIDRFAQRVD